MASTKFSREPDILEHIHEGVVTTDLSGFITGWNSGAERLFGYTKDEVFGRNILFLYADENDNDDTSFEDAFLDRGGNVLEVRRRRKNGEIFWASLYLSLLRDEDQNPTGLIAFLADITERRAAEESQRLHASIFERSEEAIMITDAHEKIVSVNKAFTLITGYEAAEVVGQTPRMFQSGKHDAQFFADMWKALKDSGYWQGEVWDRRKNGEIYPKSLSIGSFKNKTEAVTHSYSIFSDISDRKRAEGRIHHLAFFDPLTELPNRTLFTQLAEQALLESRRQSGHGAFLFVDLNRFKPINDSLGHEVGDRVLIEVAHRLRSCLRGTDVVCRFGGDEFVVGLFDIASREHAALVANKLLAVMDPPVLIDGRDLKIGAAIGVSVYPDDGADVKTLLRLADIAMYRAKVAGPDAFTFYSEDMNQRAAQRLSMENGIRKAIANNELRLYYQPKVDIKSRRVVGAEALVRWQHPERGMVPPGEFIPIAEETGLIVQIGTWVLETACKQAQIWQNAGLAAMHLAVNLSARDFSATLPKRVDQLLKEYRIGPEWLELEITEGMLMNQTETVIEMMNQLAAMGVALSLDDFGTGYSSLSYLKRFPIKTLKIDRSFVINIPEDANDCAIAGAIISLSKQLKLNVIAEGVESPEQLNFLQAAGCDEIQGYLFSPPVSAEKFEAMVREGKLLSGP